MQGQLLGPRRVHAERLRVRRRLERRRLRHAALRSGRGGQGVQRARRMRGRSVQLLPGLRRPRLRRQAWLPGRRQLLRAWALPRRRPDSGGCGAARRPGRLLHVRRGGDGARVRGRGPRLQAGTPAPTPRPTTAPTTIRTSAPTLTPSPPPPKPHAGLLGQRSVRGRRVHLLRELDRAHLRHQGVPARRAARRAVLGAWLLQPARRVRVRRRLPGR